MPEASYRLPERELATWAAARCDAAVQWLQATLTRGFAQADLVAGPLDGYAGLLAVARDGSPTVAAALIDQVVARWHVAPGEFHALDEPESMRRRAFLRNGMLHLAAREVGRWDVVTEAAVRRLFAYQHRCGGFFGIDPGQGHGQVETHTTAFGGRLALRLGDMARARAAAALIAEMAQMQPDPNERYYFAYDTQAQALTTRWRGGLPQERFIDGQEPAAEVQQLGAALALLSEMCLIEPGADWDRSIRLLLAFLSGLTTTTLRLPALGQLAEGLALAVWALGDDGEAARGLLGPALEALAGAALGTGAYAAYDSGMGGSYERAFTELEATGWTALSLASLSRVLVHLSDGGG